MCVNQGFRDRPPTVTPDHDDISVHARDFNELLQSMEYVYNRLINLCVTVKLSKVHLNMTKTRVLGHLVIVGGFKIPDPKSIDAILHMDDHFKTPEDVARFIGPVGYQREYIKGLADILSLLYDIKSKDVDMSNWKDEIHGKSVRILKEILITPSLLWLPDPIRKFCIHVHTATGRAIGGVLLQFYGNKDLENNLENLRGDGESNA